MVFDYSLPLILCDRVYVDAKAILFYTSYLSTFNTLQLRRWMIKEPSLSKRPSID